LERPARQAGCKSTGGQAMPKKPEARVPAGVGTGNGKDRRTHSDEFEEF